MPLLSQTSCGCPGDWALLVLGQHQQDLQHLALHQGAGDLPLEASTMFSTTTAPRCCNSWLGLRSRACRISSQCVVCRKQGSVTTEAGNPGAAGTDTNTTCTPGAASHQPAASRLGDPGPPPPAPPRRGTDHLGDAAAERGPHGGEHSQAPAAAFAAAARLPRRCTAPAASAVVAPWLHKGSCTCGRQGGPSPRGGRAQLGGLLLHACLA